MDPFITLICLAASACIVLAFLTGFFLGMDAMKPKSSHPFLPMRGYDEQD